MQNSNKNAVRNINIFMADITHGPFPSVCIISGGSLEVFNVFLCTTSTCPLF